MVSLTLLWPTVLRGFGHCYNRLRRTLITTVTDICRVLESIKRGCRLPESRFAPLKLAHENQGTVFGMMNRNNATRTAHG